MGKRKNIKEILITLFIASVIFIFLLFGLFGERIIKNDIRKSYKPKIYQCVIKEKEHKVVGVMRSSSAKYTFLVQNNKNNKLELIEVNMFDYDNYNIGDIIECNYYYDNNGEIKLIEINKK